MANERDEVTNEDLRGLSADAAVDAWSPFRAACAAEAARIEAAACAAPEPTGIELIILARDPDPKVSGRALDELEALLRRLHGALLCV